MSDLIDRKNTIDAMENVDWYHQNRSMEMVHGANSDDQAWYKAEDVYEVLERMPSVQPETDLQSTCNEVATDCISSRQPEIIHCKECRYSEYDQIFHNRYCHNKGKADLVGDDFFCAAGGYMTNGFD